VFVEGGACATAQWHNGLSNPVSHYCDQFFLDLFQTEQLYVEKAVWNSANAETMINVVVGWAVANNFYYSVIQYVRSAKEKEVGCVHKFKNGWTRRLLGRTSARFCSCGVPVRYKSEALARSCFLCHFLLFGDALLWVSVSITVWTSVSFLAF